MPDTNTWIAVVAAVAAVGAFFATAHQAHSARRQTRIQEQIHRDQAQPYVWADFQPDPDGKQMMFLILRNEGPTIAEDVRVTIETDDPRGLPSRMDRAAILSEGVQSLAPGRQIRWFIGTGIEWFAANAGFATLYRIRVEATGPFNQRESRDYTVDLEAWRGSSVYTPGYAKEIAKEIGKVQSVLKGWTESGALHVRTSDQDRVNEFERRFHHEHDRYPDYDDYSEHFYGLQPKDRSTETVGTEDPRLPSIDSCDPPDAP